MIDTHCHLTDPRLASQLPEVLSRARSAGVSQMITIGTELEDDRAVVALCKTQGNLRCSVGVHPGHVDQVDAAELEQLYGIQLDPTVIALGEMGLDYHYGRHNRQKQIEFFEIQLRLATQTAKPAIIHSREAMDDCLSVLSNFPAVPAIFHCFTGTLAEAERILTAGYLLGFTGVVTYKNASELREVVKITPADRIVVETDAPYLSPEPMRKQKTNEPALVMHTAAKVAELRGISLAEIDELTTRNASRFFHWPD